MTLVVLLRLGRGALAAIAEALFEGSELRGPGLLFALGVEAVSRILWLFVGWQLLFALLASHFTPVYHRI